MAWPLKTQLPVFRACRLRSERVGPMELMGNLVGTPGRIDDGADGASGRREHVGLERRQVGGWFGRDDEHAPWPAATRNGDRHLGPAAGHHRNVLRRRRKRTVERSLKGDLQGAEVAWQLNEVDGGGR